MALELNIDHAALPQIGTVYTYHSLPADKFRILPEDYPLEAVCLECDKPVRLLEPEAEWLHFRRE